MNTSEGITQPFWKFLESSLDEGLLPSTREVSSVTLAAFLRPAGRLRPRRSSFSRRHRPPFLDFALWTSNFFFKHHITLLHLTRHENNWISGSHIIIDLLFFFMKIELIKSSGLSLQKNLSLIKSCESGRKNMDLLWFDKSIKSKRLKLKHVNSLYIKCAFFLHGYDYMSPRVSSVIRLFLYPKWKVLFWKAEERCSLSFLHLLFEI